MDTEKKLYFTKIEVDGRCIDLLFTEKEIARAAHRMENPENNKFVPSDLNTCWPIVPPPSCSFWDRIIGKCNCK
jgi:hypothetical protein